MKHAVGVCLFSFWRLVATLKQRETPRKSRKKRTIAPSCDRGHPFNSARRLALINRCEHVLGFCAVAAVVILNCGPRRRFRVCMCGVSSNAHSALTVRKSAEARETTGQIWKQGTMIATGNCRPYPVQNMLAMRHAPAQLHREILNAAWVQLFFFGPKWDLCCLISQGQDRTCVPSVALSSIYFGSAGARLAFVFEPRVKGLK